jgi:hypothetical protein
MSYMYAVQVTRKLVKKLFGATTNFARVSKLKNNVNYKYKIKMWKNLGAPGWT